MLSSISEYLFGSAPSTSGQQEPELAVALKQDEKPSSSSSSSESMELEETSAEGDWVLVDVTNDRLSPSVGTGALKGKPGKGLEESWFVTPPPCFTASGHTREQLATSPMEDLLIEHPSMSVYVNNQQENRGPRRKCQRPKQVRNNLITKRCHNLRVRQTAPRPQRAAAVAARLGMIQTSTQFSIEQAEKAKRSQRKQLNRNQLEKQNKAVHQQSLGTKRHHLRNTTRNAMAFHKQPR